MTAKAEPRRDYLALPRLFGAAVLASLLYAPLALVLALTATAGLALLYVAGSFLLGRLGLTYETAPAAPTLLNGAITGLSVLAHSAFVALLFAAMRTPRDRPAAWLNSVARLAVRTTPHLTLLSAVAFGLCWISPYLTLGVWAAACVLDAPAHFAATGVAGWWTAPSAARAPMGRRLAVMAPSLLFLGLMAALFSNLPQECCGLFEGGIVVIPLLMLTTFWGSYSLALFAAAFARDH